MWNFFYFGMVFLSILAFLLKTTPSFRELRPEFLQSTASANRTASPDQTDPLLLLLNPEDRFFATKSLAWVLRIDVVCYVFFLLEFLVRLLVCPRKAWFFRQFKNGLDVVLLVQGAVFHLLDEYWMPHAGRDGVSEAGRGALIAFFCLTVLRTLRVLYLAKDFDTMKVHSNKGIYYFIIGF